MSIQMIVCRAKAVNFVLKHSLLLYVQIAPLDDGPTSRVSESSVKIAARQENGPTIPALLAMLNARFALQENIRNRKE